MEGKLLCSALKQSHGVQYKAAQLLGLKPTTLNMKLSRYGIDVKARRNALPKDALTDAKAVATAVWDQLKTCYDPEIPVNIVELGLVYENKVEPLPEGGFRVLVRFTLTAPGCGMGGILQAEAREKILSIPGVREAVIEVVFDPPWTQSMMSEAAKLQLGML